MHYFFEENLNSITFDEKNYSLDDYLSNEMKTDYNYDPFINIRNFIISDIIPMNDSLVECTLFNEDEYGEPAHEYYIKYIGNLSFNEKEQLHKNIIHEIKNFINDIDIFKVISIFLIR